MSNPAAKPRSATLVAAAVCAAAGIVLFQWFGSAAQGYVKTHSLFWWWISQWIDPTAETQHGWLVLGLAVWLFTRNLGAEENCGFRISDFGLSNRRNEPAQAAVRSAADASNEADPEVATGRATRTNNPQSAIRSPQFVAFVAALILHAVGFAAQQARLSIAALLLFTWGVLRLAGGPRWGKAAAFPLAFLVFAIPFNALDSVGFTLRAWVIDASAWLAHHAGIGVLQNGTQLTAPDGRYNYDVAPACSGIRSLMALAALSLLIGYLNFRSGWRRGLMLLLCFPLVYVGNVARISSIVFAAQAGGSHWGDIAHEVMGYGIFLIVLGGVFLAAEAVRRWLPESCHPIGDKIPIGLGEGGLESRAPSLPTVGMKGATPTAEAASARLTPYLAVAVVLLALGEMVFLHRLETMPPRGRTGVVLATDGENPVELPAFIGHDWVRWPAAVSAVERQILPPDTGFSRANYVASRDGRQVFVSIVLSGRDRTSIHRPELCLVGQGWTILGRATHVFTYPGHPDASFTATVLPVRHEVSTPRGKAMRPELVTYWFVSGDRIAATHWERLWWDSWNRIVHARADRWAYVLLQTDATDGEPAALARVQAVLNGILPAFEPPLARR